MALQPLISVIGSTGTGKSDLAIALATRLNGEIINADAMQMYTGLDIITNKHPVDERQGIPHHILGVVPITEEIRIGQFRDRALDIIADIHSRGKLPIVVGGTHYYLQSLLFNKTASDGNDSDDGNGGTATANIAEERYTMDELVAKYPVLNASAPELLAKLEEVDPVMAARWHPNDTRKVRRSLEIFFQTGRRASELYAEQEVTARFNNLIFWTHSDKVVLDKRLDDRVDKMVTRGMFDEIEQLYGLYKEQLEKKEVDLTKGIWQSIGFKEFLPWLLAPEEEKTEKLKEECLVRMKLNTVQYAKYQTRWIRTKLYHMLTATSTPMYLLDTTDQSQFQVTAVTPALRIARSFLEGGEMEDPRGLNEAAANMLSAKTEKDFGENMEGWKKYTCETCEITTIGDEKWREHLGSRRHKKKVAGKIKWEEIVKLRAAREARLKAESESKEVVAEDSDGDLMN
ncbi:tRNA isopentenyltransferase [Ascobolus immersus RN42]|uniref:tRNA dimethylallyltransferase n=1 Tax=Ascobolus immersus RN42 TaxID=1160509 RepID=A0A3N4HUP1_ASCIM|nr:tRNA isopentenyltransferase [Ascobolus immersus RN42]